MIDDDRSMVLYIQSYWFLYVFTYICSLNGILHTNYVLHALNLEFYIYIYDIYHCHPLMNTEMSSIDYNYIDINILLSVRPCLVYLPCY